MKVISMFRKDGIVPVTIAATISLFLVVSVVQATTTIGTSITTQGDLSVTGASTLTGNVTAAGTLGVTGATTLTGLTSMVQASSTRLSVFDTAYFGGSATSTFNSAGALNLVAALTGTTGSFSSTLGVTGLTSLIQASSTRLSVFDTAYFGGSATSSFSSAGVLSLTGITNALLAAGASGAVSATTTPTAQYFIATSATVASAFPYASSTAITATTGFFTTSTSTTLRANTATIGTLGVTGLSTLTGGYISASSTVVGDLTVTGTFSPAQTSASSFTVSGLTTLSQASSTRLSVFDKAYFGGSATSTFDSAGNLAMAGNTTLVNATSTAHFFTIASSTNLFAQSSTIGTLALGNALAVTSGGTGVITSTGTGNNVLSASPTLSGTVVLAAANFSGLASTTQLRVGDDNVSTVLGIITGVCSIAEISGLVASTTAQLTCSGATGVTTAYKVFVQATSSIPSQIVIQSATSSAGAIEVRFLNTGITGGTPASAAASLNFWAVR